MYYLEQKRPGDLQGTHTRPFPPSVSHSVSSISLFKAGRPVFSSILGTLPHVTGEWDQFGRDHPQTLSPARKRSLPWWVTRTCSKEYQSWDDRWVSHGKSPVFIEAQYLDPTESWWPTHKAQVQSGLWLRTPSTWTVILPCPDTVKSSMYFQNIWIMPSPKMAWVAQK